MRKPNSLGGAALLVMASAVVFWMWFTPSNRRRVVRPAEASEPDRLRELGAA